jgi:ketosteroid isomerase-like protein
MDTHHTAANTTASPGAIEAVMQAWESALAAHDLDALLACYAPDATLESPVAAHITGGDGSIGGGVVSRS